MHELGQGSFGAVYEGVIYDLRGVKGEYKCAIKTVNAQATNSNQREFLREASFMKYVLDVHVYVFAVFI